MERMIDSWGVGWFLFTSVVLLNLADFVTTDIIVSQHGYDMELNPLLRALMEYFDTIVVVLWAKVFLILVALGSVWLYAQQQLSRARVVVLPLLFLFGVYSWVVVNNLSIIWIVSNL